MMKKICTLFTASTLCVASVTAQSVSDDFNDNSRDTGLWWEPYTDTGSGQLLEQNGRVEFTAPGGAGETDVSQSVKRYPTYNQAWQVQMVVAMSPANFSSIGQVGAVSIDIGSGDHWLGMGYGAGVLSAGPSINALTAGWSVGAGDDNNITPVGEPFPAAIGIRIVYDPQRRLIRTYYDLDADQTDGEWTLYDSFTIDGSPNPGGHVLNWGMESFNNFYIAVDGFSSGPTIAAGSAWADDFEFTLGRTLPTPTFADDFNDGSRDQAIWNAPVPDANEALTETNGRLEFTTPAGAETWVVQSVNAYPNYDQPWQIQTLISVDQSQFGNNQIGYMGLGVGGPGELQNVEIGMGAGQAVDLPVFPDRKTIFSSGSDVVEGPISFFSEGLPDVIGVRMTYDPNTRIIRAYYDLDADNADGEWTLFQSYTIDNSTVAGATTLDWGMTSSDAFYLEVYGGAEGNVAVASGTAWMDDFAFNLGSTVQSESGLSFFDDFNDDSVDAAWFIDQPLGDAEFAEVNHRTEFTSFAGSGENEIIQTIGGQFYPHYNQAFDVRMEAHALPADPMATLGDVAVMELHIENDGGLENMNVSVGAANLTGSKEQAYAVNNSEVEFVPGEIANVFETGALPEVVGVRVSWNPDTQRMAVYLDVDGDRSVETWVQVIEYALDDVATGWGMSPTDLFRISLTGYAENTVVNSGEAYVDNFSLINAPLPPDLTGYELWAQDIPDEGMRGQTDDASGNGIPNLLQYMYGLTPMATDTDVTLRIQMNGGTPELIHGFNTEAADFVVDYMEKLGLTDSWSPGFTPNSIEIFSVDGKTFRRVMLPSPVGNEFFQLQIVPAP